ncbi:MAG: ABC transporter substrate-binding protein [Gemmatimonadota bacterium]|nr:ABC transporter substrate-binding protein [Gemmatimonadota bacterium]
MRVVSLLPSATEMVAALGALETLVGVTHACDHPPMVASRLRVTRSAVSGTEAPGIVDAQVRAIAASGEPLYTLLEDRIRRLHPDLLLTQALCEVCAVMETDVRALAARLEPPPRVLTLSASSLDGVFDDLTRVGAALDRADEAEEFLAGARARLRAVHDTLKAARAPRPRVAVIEWGEPVYAAGHWVPEMVRRAGGVDALAKPGAHSVVVDLAAVRAADPEVLLVAPCGYDLARAAAEGDRLLALDDWAWARAKRVWAVEANALVSRPGPRLVDGIECFARIFNPSLFTPIEPEFARPLTADVRDPQRTT